jgi:hypothetical protein
MILGKGGRRVDVPFHHQIIVAADEQQVLGIIAAHEHQLAGFVDVKDLDDAKTAPLAATAGLFLHYLQADEQCIEHHKKDYGYNGIVDEFVHAVLAPMRFDQDVPARSGAGGSPLPAAAVAMETRA